MTEWQIVLLLVTLGGIVISIITPSVKIARLLERTVARLDNMDIRLASQDKALNHLEETVNEHGKELVQHEERINHLEKDASFKAIRGDR